MITTDLWIFRYSNFLIRKTGRREEGSEIISMKIDKWVNRDTWRCKIFPLVKTNYSSKLLRTTLKRRWRSRSINFDDQHAIDDIFHRYFNRSIDRSRKQKSYRCHDRQTRGKTICNNTAIVSRYETQTGKAGTRPPIRDPLDRRGHLSAYYWII